MAPKKAAPLKVTKATADDDGSDDKPRPNKERGDSKMQTRSKSALKTSAAKENSPSAAKRRKTKSLKDGQDNDAGMFDAEAEADNGDEGLGNKEMPKKKSRKGAPVRQSAIPPALLEPGNPARPNTFLNIDGNEQRLAGYLGFDDVVKLRLLAMSWPVLNAVTSFDQFGDNMNKKPAFRLISDNESLFKNVDNFQQKWPRNSGDNERTTRDKKNRYLACVLLQLEHEIERMREGQSKLNQQKQGEMVKLYYACNAAAAGKETFPTIKFAKSREKAASGEVEPPTMQLRGESRLERINRCWHLIKYFRQCRANNFWSTRFSENGLALPISVDISHVPDWMRPPEKVLEEQGPLAKTAAVLEADALPQLEIKIVWDKEGDFDDKDEFDEALKQAKRNNIVIPSTNQYLAQDPRLCASVEYFRDSIRRQFNCQKIGLDIRGLDLKYQNATISKSTQEKDIYRDPWAETQSTFANTANIGFIIHVQFKAAEDPDNSFESFEIPPEIANNFLISDGEVRENDNGIDAIRRAAFGSSTEQPLFPSVTKAGEPDNGGLAQFLDKEFSQGGSSMKMGSAPKPKQFLGPKTRENLLSWYSDHDVTTEEGKLAWQQELLNEVTSNGRIANVKKYRLPKDISEEAAKAIEKAQELGQQAAVAMEDDEDLETVDETDKAYYTMKTAFTGTDARSGPQVDLCMNLLDCVVDPENLNMVIPQLLAKVTDRHFFKYQISGAVGAVLKLYGSIDPEKLLAATNPNHVRANLIREAAMELNDLLTHGCIIADDMGFGKTVQSLLVAFFHSILFDSRDKHGKVLYGPILLTVPATVIVQWLREIRSHWPYFTAIVSYGDHDLKDEMALHALSYSNMKEFPSLETVPENLKFIFTKEDKKALTVIIATSYETHKIRTGKKMSKIIPGKHYKPPRYDNKGDEIWKRKERTVHYWVTNQAGLYTLLIADEAQKIKNYSTGIWSVLYNQSILKILELTGTPIYNSVKDLIALLSMMWDLIRNELDVMAARDPAISKWLEKIAANDENIIEHVKALSKTDTRRLALLNPKLLARTLGSKKNIHLKVASHLQAIQDMTMIQRCQASNLPVKNGSPTPLKGLFQRMTRKTALIERLPAEELEYQIWHREAAVEYVNEISLKKDIAPSKPRRFDNAGGFIAATKSLRKLSIANFSTNLARLNQVMEKVSGNTHVKTLQAWRDRGNEAEFIQDLTRGAGEPRAKTAKKLVHFLCRGSPAIRLVFQEILAGKILGKLDVKRYKHHQKLLVVESTLSNGWYLEVLLRLLLIDGRMMHAGLSNKAKSDICDLFNDPMSTLRVMIILFDVSAIGLNLHLACDRMVSVSIPKSEAQNAQAKGRIDRVTSKFPLTFTTRHTPNSHDQFKSARQTDKATVALAANAQDPAIRELMVKLLNNLQPAVDEAHKSKRGKELLIKIEREKSHNAAILAQRQEEVFNQKRETKISKEAEKDFKSPETTTSLPEVARKRVRRQADRFDPADYHNKGGTLLPIEIRESLKRAAPRQNCEICYKTAKNGDDLVQCDVCCIIAHWECFDLSAPPSSADFRCDVCTSAKPERGEKRNRQGKGKSTLEEPEDSAVVKSSSSSSDDDEASEQDVDSEDEHDEDADTIKSNESSDTSSNFSGADISAPGRDKSESKQEAREARWAREEEEVFSRTLRLQEFVNEKQPDDTTRHLLALLAIPKDKTWTEADLDVEQFLKIGLHLLYNKIQGKEELHFEKSIHIKYDAFPKRNILAMEKRHALDERRKKAATARGLA